MPAEDPALRCPCCWGLLVEPPPGVEGGSNSDLFCRNCGWLIAGVPVVSSDPEGWWGDWRWTCRRHRRTWRNA